MIMLHALFAVVASGVLMAADGSRTLASDTFASGRSVRVDKAVAGDLMAAGGAVVVNSNVAGDAMVAGGDVRVSGAVNEDLYAAAGRVLLNGTVGENTRIGAGNVEVGPEARIRGGASIGAGEILMNGVVEGYLQAAGGHVYINGRVSGDVEAVAESVELGPNAFIAGDLRYTSPQELTRDSRSHVAGTIVRTAPPPESGIVKTVMFVTFTAGLMLLAAVLVAVRPSFWSRTEAGLRAQPGFSVLLGLACLAGIPLAALILAVTLVGIPMSLLIATLYVALILVGYVTGNVALGDWALYAFAPGRAARTSWRSGAAAASVLTLAIVGQTPVLGALIIFAVLLAGIGSLALQLRHG